MWFSGTRCERYSEIASYTPTYIVSILKGYHVLYQIWWYVMILPSVLFDFLSYVNLFYTERNIYKLADCKYICTLPTQSRWGITCCICGKCMEWFGCLDAVQELEESKRQREWAFAERDKIVSERDEVRVLCDQLRHERDGAVSDLFSALRDSDDIRRQKNDAIRELKDFRYWSHTHMMAVFPVNPSCTLDVPSWFISRLWIFLGQAQTLPILDRIPPSLPQRTTVSCCISLPC